MASFSVVGSAIRRLWKYGIRPYLFCFVSDAISRHSITTIYSVVFQCGLNVFMIRPVGFQISSLSASGPQLWIGHQCGGGFVNVVQWSLQHKRMFILLLQLEPMLQPNVHTIGLHMRGFLKVMVCVRSRSL